MSTYILGSYIGGQWVKTDSEPIIVKNPATGEQVGTVANAGKEETQQAIEAASQALPAWSKLTAAERASLMHKYCEVILQNKEELAKLVTLEMGRPYTESLGEVDYAVSFIEWFAEEGKRLYGRIVPGKSPDHRIQVIKQPIGIVAAITPWNFPASMITRKLGPALAAGCTFIVKPAAQTPLTALKLAEWATEAGIPPGVVNVLCNQDPNDFTDVIMQDTRVRKVSFTGSTEIGRLIMRKSAEQIKRVSLELGGHAPFIICEDADLEKAVSAAMASKFRNGGQTCVCANRFYVHEKIYEPFIEKFAEKIGQLRLGNGLDQQTDVGPLVDKPSFEKVTRHVQDALEKGATCVVGGKGQADGNQETYFFEPTLLTDMNEEMLLMNDETFGPVAGIQKFHNDEEVITWANDTPFGLAAYLFTQNVSRGTHIVEQLEYGIVGWNDGVPSTVQAPFGGVKQSGLGREGSKEGLEEYVTTKYISLKV